MRPDASKHCRAGGSSDGDDAAQILKASWRETRRSVMRGAGVAEFSFRQYLFACQARVLLKLGRPAEVRRYLQKWPGPHQRCLSKPAFWLGSEARYAYAAAAGQSSGVSREPRLIQVCKSRLSQPAAPWPTPDSAGRTCSFEAPCADLTPAWRALAAGGRAWPEVCADLCRAAQPPGVPGHPAASVQGGLDLLGLHLPGQHHGAADGSL